MCLIRHRLFVRINHSAELNVWRIKRSQLYSAVSSQNVRMIGESIFIALNKIQKTVDVVGIKLVNFGFPMKLYANKS